MSNDSTIRNLVSSELSNPDLLQMDSAGRSALGAALPPVLAKGYLGAGFLRTTVPKFLDIPLADLLVGAWSKLREVREFRGQGDHGEVTLADHSVEATYRPTVTLQTTPPLTEPWTVEFELQLKADVSAVVLSVDCGKIRGLSPCTIRLGIELLWKGHEILKLLQTERIPLAPHIELGEGIPIP